jgi:hypothetical protein
MSEEPALIRGAEQAVTDLLEALRAGDVAKYHALMTASDQGMMSVEDLGQTVSAMREQSGPLISFTVEGTVMHAAAGHAAVHVTLEFEKTGAKTELYNLAFADGAWRLDFDFAELMGGGVF